MTDPPNPDAVADTRRWIERAVIGLPLCPFAGAVLARGQVRFALSAARDDAGLAADLALELQHLAAADPARLDTTLLVAPHALPVFEDFNDFLGLADALLAELGLEGTIQIASFHPGYRFAGAAPDDPANASNRSPHPTLHLLREASVERALAGVADADAVWRRNVETLRRLGADGWAALWRSPR